MKTNIRTLVPLAMSICLALLTANACQTESEPSNSTLEVTSGRDPNAYVSGECLQGSIRQGQQASLVRIQLAPALVYIIVDMSHPHSPRFPV